MLGPTRRKFLAAAGAVVGLSGTVQAQELPPKNESNDTSDVGATPQSEGQEQDQKQEQNQPDGPHLNDAGAGVFPEGSGSIIEDVTRSSDGVRMTLFFPADQSEAPNHDQGSAMPPGGNRNGGLLGGQNQGRSRGQRGQQGSPASGIRKGNGQNRGQQQGPGDAQNTDGASSGIMGFGANANDATQSGNGTNGSNTSR